MELILTKENEDGSADFDIKLTCVEVQQLVNVGLIEIMKRAFEEGKHYDPRIAEATSEPSVGDTGSGEPSCAYGPCVKSGKPEQPCICSETTPIPY
jgi:hypothetical protein